ncbi:MAG: radical SAM protein [Clostridia bacterium]|nr:radical SAM protein [Clostridia bacterium]
MNDNFDLQTYLTNGAEQIVKDAVRATLRNPRESAFMAKYALASAAGARRRRVLEGEGVHVPTYLICSITSRCNLHCAGCYSRCAEATQDAPPVAQLTDAEWAGIFDQAEDLGVGFILLAGGEPLLRRGVIEAASKRPDIIFPIFTNGTYMDEAYFDLFDRCRNLVPVMSLEGGRERTDARRGAGVYDRLLKNMEALDRRGAIFGASVTVTTENLDEAVSAGYIDDLAARGCKAVFYIEYVPVDGSTRGLAFGDAERDRLREAIDRLRARRDDVLFIAFPGDEKDSGGCLAAGRGFFHINSHGGAEPCPFSPYSDINVREATLRDAIASPLFTALQSGGLLLDDHIGGCVLHEKRVQVAALLDS